MILETGVFLVIHSVEIAQIYSQTIFRKNYVKSTPLSSSIEVHCCYCNKLDSRKMFEMRGNFSFFHTVYLRAIALSLVSEGELGCPPGFMPFESAGSGWTVMLCLKSGY